MKKKVVLLIPSFSIGGAEMMVMRLADNLNKSEFDVKVISMYPKVGSFIESLLEQKGIETIYMNKRKTYKGNGNRFLSNLIFFKELYLEMRKISPDIVHSHLYTNIYVAPWTILNRKNLIHTLHSTPEEECGKIIYRLMKILYRLKMATPVAISESLKVKTAKYYDLPIERVEFINNPVDIDISKKSTHIQQDGETIKFINVARLNPNKNQEFLIYAFKQVKKFYPKAKLFILGEGELRSHLSEVVIQEGLDDEVVFTGNVPNVFDYLSESDVFVLTSHFEGMPLSILEAMSAGLPIIASNVGGIPDLIDGNGILFEDNDTQGLINAMLNLAQNEKNRVEMGRKSLENIKLYDAKFVADLYGELYKKILRS